MWNSELLLQSLGDGGFTDVYPEAHQYPPQTLACALLDLQGLIVAR